MKVAAVTASALIGLLGLGMGVDSDDLTIHAYPTVLRLDQRVIVTGDLTPARANESVTVQGKECGVPGAFFRDLWGASTSALGDWQAEFYMRSTTELRAVSGNQTSPELTVRVRWPLYLSPMPSKSGRFRLAAWPVTVPTRGKRVAIERFDATARKWRIVRRLVLDETGFVKGFRIRVPKRTTVRARIPLSQTSPCYLAGYSRLVRT